MMEGSQPVAPEPGGIGRVPPAVGLWELFFAFSRLGLMTFGGAVQSWLRRDIILRRKWVDEDAFITGLSIATVLPGANPVNMSLYLGMRIRGGIGGAVAVVGIVLPAFCIILLLGLAFNRLIGFPIVHFVLAGLAASGVGVTFFTALGVAKRLPRDVFNIAMGVLVFVASAVLRLPMVPIVAVAVPLSVGYAYLQVRRAHDAA
jgi:chromate transporter